MLVMATLHGRYTMGIQPVTCVPHAAWDRYKDSINLFKTVYFLQFFWLVDCVVLVNLSLA